MTFYFVTNVKVKENVDKQFDETKQQFYKFLAVPHGMYVFLITLKLFDFNLIMNINLVYIRGKVWNAGIPQSTQTLYMMPDVFRQNMKYEKYYIICLGVLHNTQAFQTMTNIIQAKYKKAPDKVTSHTVTLYHKTVHMMIFTARIITKGYVAFTKSSPQH